MKEIYRDFGLLLLMKKERKKERRERERERRPERKEGRERNCFCYPTTNTKCDDELKLINEFLQNKTLFIFRSNCKFKNYFKLLNTVNFAHNNHPEKNWSLFRSGRYSR